MDGLGDYHTKWSKSDRGGQISYDGTSMWILKKWYKWTYLQSRNRLIDLRELSLWLWQGKSERKDRLGVWFDMHTGIFKIDNQQGPTLRNK